MNTLAEANVEVLAGDLYRRARRQAQLNRWIAALTRRPNRLLAFEDVQKRLQIVGRHHGCLCPVPVRSIVGTVGRYYDFDRNFNPLRSHTRERWQSISRAMLKGITLPPVELYKLGDAYFVKDGNHRVSVARHQGLGYVDALVTEFTTTTPVSLYNIHALTGQPSAA
jgi:hypothetical protein